MADTPKPAVKTSAKIAKVTRWRAKSAEQTAEKDTILPSKKRKVSEIVGLDKTKRKTTPRNVKSKAEKPVPRPVGRPSDYTEAMGDMICERMCEGESLRAICLGEDMPSKTTVFRWLAVNEVFRDQYGFARTIQAETMGDELISIADDGRNDTYKDEEGRVKIDTDVIARSRLRIDTRKWIMSKLIPKKYGEKVDVNHGGQTENPMTVLMSQVAGKTFKPVDE